MKAGSITNMRTWKLVFHDGTYRRLYLELSTIALKSVAVKGILQAAATSILHLEIASLTQSLT
eukprot:6208305-Pleurochrysis_carterae.AAC.1